LPIFLGVTLCFVASSPKVCSKYYISTGQALDPCHLPASFDLKIKEQKELDDIKIALPKPRKISSGQTGVIGLVNQTYDIEQVLQHYGYSKQGEKWLHPQSKSNMPGIVILDGRYYSHHSCDNLNDNYTHDIFDLLLEWRFYNDMNLAIETLANELDQFGQKQRQKDHIVENNKLLHIEPTEEPEIIPINIKLPEVECFDYDLLPHVLHDWIKI
jgi:hypothetical protein